MVVVGWFDAALLDVTLLEVAFEDAALLDALPLTFLLDVAADELLLLSALLAEEIDAASFLLSVSVSVDFGSTGSEFVSGVLGVSTVSTIVSEGKEDILSSSSFLPQAVSCSAIIAASVIAINFVFINVPPC